jgi:hypothetical protein
MPVNLLFCEGGAGSPDVRLLRSITRGVATVRIQPQGAKYGLGQFVRAYREAAPQTIVAGIRDSDFDRHHNLPAGQIRDWRVENDHVWLGWFWERTEIENYLLDPAIITRLFSPDVIAPAWYHATLDAAITALLDYTAARATLSRSRGRYEPLPNIWGTAAGIADHVLPLPCTEADCRVEIERIIETYGARIQAAQALTLYDQLLGEYRSAYYHEPLLYFSGKDIVCAMREPLQQVGFPSPGAFREKVLKLIEASPGDIWTWLPEWNALRSAIQSVGSNNGPV